MDYKPDLGGILMNRTWNLSAEIQEKIKLRANQYIVKAGQRKDIPEPRSG